jgi:hypothetical protein
MLIGLIVMAQIVALMFIIDDDKRSSKALIGFLLKHGFKENTDAYYPEKKQRGISMYHVDLQEACDAVDKLLISTVIGKIASIEITEPTVTEQTTTVFRRFSNEEEDKLKKDKHELPDL